MEVVDIGCNAQRCSGGLYARGRVEGGLYAAGWVAGDVAGHTAV